MRIPLLLTLALTTPTLAQDLLVTCPHSSAGEVYKGQLHCHSTRSDGKQSPETLFRAYGGVGYDFVALTDHLRRTLDPGVPGMTWIRASEVHTKAAEKGDGWSGHHLGALGIKTDPTRWDRSTTAKVLDRIDNEGGTAMANHPRLRNRWSTEELVAAKPLQLLSIFNGRGFWRANQILPGSGAALFANAAHWDQALGKAQILWGVAADDCHDVTDPAQFNQGWVLVRAPSRSEADLLKALRHGDFYACRGTSGKAPSLTVRATRRVDGVGWDVTARSEPGVQLHWIAGGKIVAKGPGPVLAYTPRGDEGTVRAEALGAGNGRTYSQPLEVVRSPRMTLTVKGSAVRLRFEDGVGRAVTLRQPLRLRIRDSDSSTLQLQGGAPAQTILVPAGVSSATLTIHAPAGAVLESTPDRGWPAAELPR
jgi:hypothetical protein